jgi:hypothetical protein
MSDYGPDDLRQAEEARERTEHLAYEDWLDDHTPEPYDDDEEGDDA